MSAEHHRIKLFDPGPLVCSLFRAAFGATFIYLTSGVFLSGLVILMGTGDALVSHLSVIVSTCGVLILLFSAFLGRFQSRKRLTPTLTALSKLAILLIVMIPAFLPERLQLVIFIPAVITTSTLQAQTTVVLNQWMLGLMNEKKSGRYISLRQTVILFVIVVLSLAAGRFMDHMGGEYTGSVILFTFAVVMGTIEPVLLVRIPDSAAEQTAGQGCKFGDVAKLPLKNQKFAGPVLYILLFYLLLYISDSLTMVCLMKHLALSYQTVNILYMIISLPQIILLGIWGKISNRRGHHFMLASPTWLFAGETLFMSLASPETWFSSIPITFLISSVANVGFVVTVFNQQYELMLEENRTVYDNFYTVAIGLGFVLDPTIGGATKYLLEESVFLTNVISSVSIRLLYPISTVGVLLLQIIYLFSQGNRKELTYVNR